ncbi:MAG: type IV-A pilus assembly ATPase PilB [Gammaproteobacteria bacterium]|nr:type IV-A pilus assembly ATPase PilB [Gammaproteobacteria bacterium]MBL6998472.1 type IV-A pilus assembly ATPase PilB [Gammaproteobacteria bacterium]
MTTTNTSPLTGLARRLVTDQAITEEVAAKAISKANEDKISLHRYLIKNKIVTPSVIAMAFSEEFGLPVFDLKAMDMEHSVHTLVSEKLITKHYAVPLFKRGNRLFVAISNPTNMQALDEFKFNTGLLTEAVLVQEDQLEELLTKAVSAMDTDMGDMLLDDDLENLDIEAGEEDDKDTPTQSDANDAPVVKFVNKILVDAINKGASDIHFEPYEKRYRIRYRIDGILGEVASPPINIAGKLTARVKVMSRMDIAERRVPQDGRIKLNLSKKRAIDFRVNTCPTLFGEKIVLRILDSSSAKLGIDALGYEPEQKAQYMKALANPYGMILVTGPTGSGKTVSLYTGLNILNVPETNISTAEDPVEINLEGINQVNVNVKVGLTFAEALRAFLRQDPDIVMVGEIRDLETAEIAIKAAQTGHLVLSTLHTNDAPQTLTRLMNMGVPPFNIATSVSLIIAQRLGRRLCKNCKAVDDLPREVLIEEGFTEEDLAENLTIYKAVGCDQCTGGYKGRVGIYQVMTISDEMTRMIMTGANSIDLADQARKEGIDDLRRSALKKIKQGVISLEEANRVTKD